MDSTKLLSSAEWIGAPVKTTNTDIVNHYAAEADFSIEEGGSAFFAIAARNRDYYMLVEINEKYAAVSEVSHGEAKLCGRYESAAKLCGSDTVRIEAARRNVTVTVNGVTVIDAEELIPKDYPNQIRKAFMMKFGLPQLSGRVRYSRIKLMNTQNGEVYQESDFSDDSSVLSALGSVTDGSLIVENTFNLINPVPAVNVRRVFDVEKEVKSAVLYASARGAYDAYINGERVNATFYNPGFTDYRKRIYYQTYDVTEKLKTGRCSVGAVVGKGYYSGFCGYSGAAVYGGFNTFLGALVIEYTDGTRGIIKTDSDWQFTDKGPVTEADYQQGESYDARLEFDWSGDGNIWRECGVYEYPRNARPTNGTFENEPFELEPQPENGAVIERILKPVSDVCEIPKGHFVYDLGQNMVGTVRIRMNGTRGKALKVRYGEMCYKDGRIYNENFRNAANVDIYTMKGGREEFFPSLTSHGFRYIEISGCGEKLTREDFDALELSPEGIVITNTPEVTGSFECSNPDINKLFENIIWGQRGNSLLIYTDCPQRNERMGWTGDAQVFAKTAAYNMNIRSFMAKWLKDLRDGQLMYNLNGAVPDTAPLGGDNRPYGGCAGWGDAAVIVPWEMYKAYGDISFLEDNYDMMKKWVEYQNLPENQKDYIQKKPNRGDHLAPDDTTPFILSATAYAANSAHILSKAARVLGNDADAEKYDALFESIKDAFNKRWVNEDGTISYYIENSGGATRASQTAYALAIDFGLIEKDKLEGAKKGLSETIEEFGNKISVGFLGISHIMSALTKLNMTETAFGLLEQTEYPGWLYSVKNGATTIWERWNSYIAETDTFGNVNMNSFNHYAYGAVGEWMYSVILGINTSEKKGETGYKHIILKPSAGGSMTWARGSLKTRCGIIKSAWRIEGDKFKYTCSVPENTSADLYLGGKKIPLESGAHEFEIQYSN